MGNISSTPSTDLSPEKEFENFYEVIDYIATYYIMTMDFKSLSKLAEKDYCNKLIILTSDIIKNQFNEREITFLEQRVRNGVQINAFTTDRFMFIDRDNLEKMDIYNDTKTGIKKSTKKNRVCIGIAKFYIKIAHIFAAIVMTINPVYVYKDASIGLSIKKGILEKENIPSKTERKVYKVNICDNRINSLRNGEIIDETSKTTLLQPTVCDMNVNPDNSTKTLQDEPGIPELRNLYNDQYDPKTGTFSGMTPETLAEYKADLKTFYTAFTGEDDLPPDCTSFSCIKLRDYRNSVDCQEPHPKFKNSVRINTSDSLFVAYAKHLKKMVKTAADNQIKLLDVINELFTYTVDPVTKKRNIRVNPLLTEKSLQESVKKTRKFIIDLYVKCETDYNEGVKIFQAIVESKNAQIVPRQIASLTEESNKIIQGVAAPVAAPVAVSEIESSVNESNESRLSNEPNVLNKPIVSNEPNLSNEPNVLNEPNESSEPIVPSLSSLSNVSSVSNESNESNESNVFSQRESLFTRQPLQGQRQNQGGKNTLKKNKKQTKQTKRIKDKSKK